MKRLLALGLTDVFRAWHPQVEGAYTWWSMRLNKRLEIPASFKEAAALAVYDTSA